MGLVVGIWRSLAFCGLGVGSLDAGGWLVGGVGGRRRYEFYHTKDLLHKGI